MVRLISTHRVIGKCKICSNPIYHTNKTGVCSDCQSRSKKPYINIYKVKYEELKKQFERYKFLTDKLLVYYYKKLKKYNLKLRWVNENE